MEKEEEEKERTTRRPTCRNTGKASNNQQPSIIVSATLDFLNVIFLFCLHSLYDRNFCPLSPQPCSCRPNPFTTLFTSTPPKPFLLLPLLPLLRRRLVLPPPRGPPSHDPSPLSFRFPCARTTRSSTSLQTFVILPVAPVRGSAFTPPPLSPSLLSLRQTHRPLKLAVIMRPTSRPD